jgi:pilus assembly protein CpaB
MSRHKVTLGLALGVGLITSIVSYNWLNQGPVSNTVAQALPYGTATVAVASAALSWGTVFTDEMVKLVDYPDSGLPQGHFDTPQSLVGRVLLANLQPNEPILESKLAPLNVETGGVAAVISPNKRAMSVRVNEVVGVGGFIKPGDRVDVMVTIDKSGSAQGRKIVAKTILENMLILASGTQMERQGKEEEAVPVKYITLEVSTKEAEKLALATTEGKITMAMRSPLNIDSVLTRGETIPSLLASYKPKQKKRTVRLSTKVRVEVLKGVEKKSVKVSKL